MGQGDIEYCGEPALISARESYLRNMFDLQTGTTGVKE
jgi:hypothetical protein